MNSIKCLKIKHKSKTQARKAIKHINRKRISHNKPSMRLYYYKCPYCNFFHLTKINREKADELYGGKSNDLLREIEYWKEHFNETL